MGLKKIRPFTFLHKKLGFWSTNTSLHGLGLRPIFYLLHGLDFKAQKYKRVHHRGNSSHKCLTTHKQCLASCISPSHSPLKLYTHIVVVVVVVVVFFFFFFLNRLFKVHSEWRKYITPSHSS